MKKLVLALILALITTVAFADHRVSKTPIVLEAKNTLLLRGEVNSVSVSKVIQKAMEMSAKLKKTDQIFLVVDSPGGSIIAGNRLIATLQALPQKVHTITLMAISMGFQIVQQMGKRLATQDAIFMSHRAHIGGINGQLYGEAESRLLFYRRLVDIGEKFSANRIGISVKLYRQKILNEWYIHGFDSVKEGVADEVVPVYCGASLSGTNEQKIQFFMWRFKVTFSNCPIVTGPLKIEPMKTETKTDKKKPSDSKVKKIINTRKFSVL